MLNKKGKFRPFLEFIGILDSNENVINPATSDNQTNGEHKTKLVDEYGNDIEGTMLSQLKVAQSIRLAGGIFNNATLDSNFYTAVTANNGTVTVLNTEAIVTVTADADSYAGFYTNSIARYIGANMNYYRSVKRLGTIETENNTRRCGCCDILPIVDGFFFQIKDGVFQVVVRKGGEDTTVSSGSFNGDGTQSELTITVDANYHTYEIYYTSKRIMFVIDEVPIHTFIATNGPLVNTRHFRAFMDNSNTGVGTATTCNALSSTINRYGSNTTQGKTYFQQGTTAGIVLKVGPGALHLLNISGVEVDSVINIYDGLTTDGRLIWSSGVQVKTSLPFGVDLDGAGGTLFYDGLFITITGATSNLFIKYE